MAAEDMVLIKLSLKYIAVAIQLLSYQKTGNPCTYLAKRVQRIGEGVILRPIIMVTLQELAAAQSVTLKSNVVYWSFREGQNSVDRSHLNKK